MRVQLLSLSHCSFRGQENCWEVRTGAPGVSQPLKNWSPGSKPPSMESVLPVLKSGTRYSRLLPVSCRVLGPPAGSTSLPLLATDLRDYSLTWLILT